MAYADDVCGVQAAAMTGHVAGVEGTHFGKSRDAELAGSRASSAAPELRRCEVVGAPVARGKIVASGVGRSPAVGGQGLKLLPAGLVEGSPAKQRMPDPRARNVVSVSSGWHSSSTPRQRLTAGGVGEGWSSAASSGYARPRRPTAVTSGRRSRGRQRLQQRRLRSQPR